MPIPVRHLIVIPCPNGKTAGGKGRLSVYLAPRLREDGDLSDYDDWRDWGTTVNSGPGLQFQVLIDGVTLPPPAVTVVSPAVTASAWRAVFGHPSFPPVNVQVEKMRFLDRTVADLHAFNSRTLSTLIENAYRTLTALGTTKPNKSHLAAALAGNQAVIDEALNYMAPIGNGLDPEAPSLEFHQLLRFLASHPYLMRQLGLVWDLEVTLPATPFSHVAVLTNWPSLTSDVRTRDQVPLRMQVDLDFEPLVRQPGYREGRWLKLAEDVYSVSQVNIVNGTIALDTMTRIVADADGPTTPVQVPAIDDAGISIVIDDPEVKFADDMIRARELEDEIDDYILGVVTDAPLIFAEDANIGFRFDVRDLAGVVYRSLHQRRVPAPGYEFPRNPGLVIAPPDDEGWASAAINTDGRSTSSPKATTVDYPRFEGVDVAKKERLDTTSWRVSDHLMTWSGWSLSAPRPGDIVGGDGTTKQRPPNASRPDDPAQVDVQYVPVPATLPRLRYNHRYQFRARCVDLAGNSHPLSLAAISEAFSDQITYGRVTPVLPPTVLRRESRPDPGVGDLVDVLVIKSELGQSDSTVTKVHRFLFPPSIAQNRLERHGLPPADGIDSADYSFLATRDAATLAGQCFEDPDTGELVAGAAVVGGAVTPGPFKQPVTYLPDPVADGVAFQSLPRRTSTTPLVMKVGTWPDYECVTLELKAGSSAPSTSTSQRRVTVALPKGTIDTIIVSSSVSSRYLPHMKFFQLLSPSQQRSNRTKFQRGQSHLISPTREITLVHAVRLPLSPPSFRSMTGSRSVVGQTTASLTGELNMHRATSNRLVLRARWTDPVDDTANPGPSDVTSRSLAADIDYPTSTTSRAQVSGAEFDLGDTKRHLVTLNAESFCSFSPYFTEQKDWSSTQGTGFVLHAGGVAQGSVQVRNRTTGEVYEEGANYRVNYGTGTVTPKNGGGIPNGTPLRALYIPLPVSRRSSEATSNKTIQVTVPASRRPAPPDVLHVLPAFARTVSQTSTKITVTHDGRVLRVFMKRPWYTSGDGELLGVAIDLAAVVSPELTRWGRDPLAPGPGATVRPTSASFKKAVTTVANVDGKFDIAAHTAVYDEARQLWFADVQVNATFGYRPFVHLFVCRYQPVAIAGEHVSETVPTQTQRLGPPRVVTVTRRPNHNVEVKLTGPDNVNVVTVQMQDVDPTIGDLDLRWRDVGAPVVLTRSGTTATAQHKGTVPIPVTGNARRLIIEDAEPLTHEAGGVLVAGSEIAYREVVTLPANW